MIKNSLVCFRKARGNMRKKRMSLCDKAEAALKSAVKKVIERHKQTGRPLAVWKDGKVALISPYKIK